MDNRQKNCRQATTEELAEMTGLSSDKIIESMVVSENTVSADARFSEDEDGALLDIIPDKDALPADSRVEAESIKIEIGRLLEVLPERARNILKAIYGIGCREMTIDKIGERYGLTRERVRQISEKSLRRLRAPEIVRNLRPYLG
uniref:sigma-70 family RNA polymerase sigma factor n=1 Tax=Candidatus Cryptobacteroides bacterium TaxID=3085639 RepID=UPI00402756D4